MDQKLWEDVSIRNYVQRFLGIRGMQALNFNVEFGRSMVKMSNIGIKTGDSSPLQSCHLILAQTGVINKIYKT